MIKIFSRKVIYNLCNYLLLITPDSIILLITITFLKKNYLLHSITVINDFNTYYFDYILLITPSLVGVYLSYPKTMASKTVPYFTFGKKMI